MSIKKMIYGMLSALVILSILSATSTLWVLNHNKDNGRVVNYAGKVRGTGQRMMKLYVLDENIDEQKAAVTDVLNALINGSDELSIPKPVDAAFIADITEVQAHWNSVVLPLFSAEKPYDKALVLKASEDFFTLTDQAVGAAEQFTDKGIVVLKIMVAVTLALMLFAILIIGQIVHKRILNPIKMLESSMAAFAKGDLQSQVSVHVSNELGKLADSIDNSRASVNSYIREIASATEEMAQGNLAYTFSSAFVGDYQQIETAIIRLTDRLSSSLTQISMSAEQVASGSSQVSDGAQSLSQGTTEQASAVQQLSATISEVTAQVSQNATSTADAHDLAVAATASISQSNDKMQQLMTAMTDINAKSSQISKIIKTIEDIAFQTNILALNAAVESARAGVVGKGFAVVADEVRNLAGKSAEAAKSTGELIAASVDAIHAGVALADSTAHELLAAVDGAVSTTAVIDKISQASQAQANSLAQVALGIEQISAVVQTNSATSEQSAAASEELSGQATLMREMIARFTLKERQSVADERGQARAAAKPAAPTPTLARHTAHFNPDHALGLAGEGKY